MDHPYIPVLPLRPRQHPLEGQVHRSYPVGRNNFSRICQGENFVLTITTQHTLPKNIQAKIITSLNVKEGEKLIEIPFEQTDDKTLNCKINPLYAGCYTFHVAFTLNQGLSWSRDSVPDAWVLVDPPQVDKLRLYTLIPTVSGNFSNWKTDLKRIAGMGFNAIHLLPITPLDASESPYAARELFGIDISYLDSSSKLDALEQLEDFVQEAKKLKIKLCFDLVLNHIGVASQMAQQSPDWIVPDQNQADGLQRSRYWDNNKWNLWNDLVLINYEHPSKDTQLEIWNYMTYYALFWANYADQTDGFLRFDNLHSSNADFIASLSKSLQDQFPSIAIIAEYFTDDQSLLNTVPEWGLHLILATTWNFKFVPELRNYLRYLHRDSENIRYFMPLTSHDAGSPAQEFGSADSTFPRYAASALMGNGATGIIQGVEYGESERINFIGKKPKIKYAGEPRFAHYIGQINGILSQYSSFCHERCHFVDRNHASIIAAYRKSNELEVFGFLIICNFDIEAEQSLAVELSTILNIPPPYACVELLSGESKFYQLSHTIFSLSPCGVQVLKFKRL
jgi:hypothetical protein